jgi:predicted nucleic acid-binding protein
MIVVADTSPLNYLIQIDSDGLLHSLYGRVLVPPAVMGELNHAGAPDIVHAWLRRLPSWIDIGAVIAQPDETLASLDSGEREAIQLAEERHADLLLIDERKGRMEAQRRGLLTTGTLGVLVAAGDIGLIDPEKTYERLISITTFRNTPRLQSSFFDVVRSRRKDC